MKGFYGNSPNSTLIVFSFLSLRITKSIISLGRERQHASLARELINNFVQTLSNQMPIRIEEPLSAQGGQLMTIIAKK